MSTTETRDANGAVLNDGDTVFLTKDLKAGGSSLTFKRGEVIKNIRLIEDDPKNVECQVGKSTIIIKTEFLKKK